MSEFAGRVMLVTGATGGLGSAVVKTFLGAGASVAAVSRSSESGLGQDRLLPVSADLTTAEGARDAVNETLHKLGRIHALIHLLGGFAGGQPVSETEDSTWRHMMALNLDAAFYAIRAALPPMLAARSGRIVAVGSRTGAEPSARLSAYGASKAGLIALVQTTALEVRNAGITANVVLPSVIDTPQNRKAEPSADYSKWVKPEAIAALLKWLASDAASDVNGAVIPIYGRA